MEFIIAEVAKAVICLSDPELHSEVKVLAESSIQH